MPKIVEVPGMGNVEFPDTMDDNAIGAAITKQVAPEQPGLLRRSLTWATTPFENVKPILEQQRATAGAAPLGLTKDSGDLMAGAHAAVSGIPGYQQNVVSPEAAERAGQFRQDHPILGTVLPLAAGMSKPGMLQQRAPNAVDPVLEQIQRVNGAAGSATETLPALPKTLEFLLPSKVTKVYQFLRNATQKAAQKAGAGTENPYPAEVSAREPWQMPPPAAPVAKQADPALQAAAEASRARVMANAERMRVTPEASPEPVATPTPAPTPVQSVLPQATAKPAQVLNPFEAAARSNKVAELVKAIDANAGVHLGVDPRDPRFAAALADLPQQWWDGMAQVTKINKPSPETINQALEFFRDRAAQTAAPQIAAGQ